MMHGPIDIKVIVNNVYSCAPHNRVLWNILTYLRHWEIKSHVLLTSIAAKLRFGETDYVTQINTSYYLRIGCVLGLSKLLVWFRSSGFFYKIFISNKI